APLRARPALGVSVGEQQSHYCDTEQNKTDRAHGSSPSPSFRAANAKAATDPSAELARINNNIASAWPWAARIRARGSTGSDCKIRGCRRLPPARTFRRLAECNCSESHGQHWCPRTTAFEWLGCREGRAALPPLRPLRRASIAWVASSQMPRADPLL